VLRTALHRHRFDTIHGHGVYPTGYLAHVSCAASAAPVVITAHGNDITPAGLKKRQPYVRRRILAALRGADVVIASSRHWANALSALCADHAPIVTIPHGIHVDDAPIPAEADWPNEARTHGYFGFVGRFKPRDGADLLLRAFARIAAMVPEHLVLGGDGEQRVELERLARELSIHNRVHFLGAVADRRRQYLMQNASLGVVPSRGPETFAISALEFMAAGRPIVASDVPGLSELVVSGSTGELFPAENVAALGDRLLALSYDERRREQMGRLARLRSRQFDAKTSAARHVALYEQLLEARRAGLRGIVVETDPERTQYDPGSSAA
jgi:phosphatidylinositol alpha-mannosyltransferase